MRIVKNICLIMNDNSYCGREYISALQRNNIFIDIILIGFNDSFDELEDKRCGGLWSPLEQSNYSSKFCISRFNSLNDPLFIRHLIEANYSLGIQGGTGIINDNCLNKFSEGILNFHPGDLPFYRGCSAPEYQYLHGNKIISSCHFLSKGIDEGDLVDSKILNVDTLSYFSFRASIYPMTSEFVVSVIKRWLIGEDLARKPQDESLAIYNKYIGDNAIDKLIKNWGKPKE